MTSVLEEPVAVTLTAEEYAQLPPSSRMELVDGVLTVGEPRSCGTRSWSQTRGDATRTAVVLARARERE